MDDRKKVNEWCRKNNYRHCIIVAPLPAGERFGFNVWIRNVPLDKDIKLATEEKLDGALAKAEEMKAFFGCPVKVQDTEAKTSQQRREAREKKK